MTLFRKFINFYLNFDLWTEKNSVDFWAFSRPKIARRWWKIITPRFTPFHAEYFWIINGFAIGLKTKELRQVDWLGHWPFIHLNSMQRWANCTNTLYTVSHTLYTRQAHAWIFNNITRCTQRYTINLNFEGISMFWWDFVKYCIFYSVFFSIQNTLHLCI